MEERIMQKVSTGVAGFDRLLGGGVEPQVITQFVGEAGSGKSTLCMIAAVSVLRQGGGVVYVDSEGFSVERFSQIAGDDTPEFLKRVYVFEPMTFAEQGSMIASAETLLRAGKADILVVDSATALYRMEQMETKEALSMLSHQMMVLLALAKRFNVPALITNQVFMDVERNRLKGLGGTALAHISKAIVRVEKHEGFRRAVVVKHRSRPEGDFWDFVMTGAGVSDR